MTLTLTQAARRYLVRFTGGCGNMSVEDAAGLEQMFTQAFQGFNGALLFGGTRMIRKDDGSVIPSITEIPPLIRAQNPLSRSLGIVPQTEDLRLSPEYGMVVCDEKDYVTVVHPQQDLCGIIQESVDVESRWEAEYIHCLTIIETMRIFGGWQTLLICYNGGGVTEKELLATCARNLPVLLIKDSGRVTETFARDQSFLTRYPSVMTCENNSPSLRRALLLRGVLEDLP